jgi:hypothetical protein
VKKLNTILETGLVAVITPDETSEEITFLVHALATYKGIPISKSFNRKHSLKFPFVGWDGKNIAQWSEPDENIQTPALEIPTDVFIKELLKYEKV